MKKIETITLADNGYDGPIDFFDFEHEDKTKDCLCIYCGKVIDKSEAEVIEITYKCDVSHRIDANFLGAYYETLTKNYSYDAFECKHCHKIHRKASVFHWFLFGLLLIIGMRVFMPETIWTTIGVIVLVAIISLIISLLDWFFISKYCETNHYYINDIVKMYNNIHGVHTAR